jgi:hypothetical protein
MSNNILFYSLECKHSKLILQKLQDENMINDFKLIDIKKIKVLPKIITSVPTIIAKDINRPLVGIHAFNWIENTKYFYQKTNNIKNVVKFPPKSKSSDKGYNKADKMFDDYASLNDSDDEKITKEKFITSKNNNFKIMDKQEVITDVKVNQDVQQRKLNELMLLRNKQLEAIISNEK